MTQNRPQLQIVRPDTEAQTPGDSQPGTGEPVAIYVYKDEHGTPLHRTLRFEPKAFRQERYVNGTWKSGLEDVEPILYNLDRLVAAPHQTRYLCEGEKDADRLSAIGLLSTTSAMGAGHWNASHAVAFGGADVVILADNDRAGKTGAEKRAASVYDIARSVKIVEFPDLRPGGDVSDYLDLYGENALKERIAKTPKWHPNSVMSAQDVMALELPEIKWAINGVAPEGLLIVGGPPKVGKSFLMIGLGAAIARGAPFLGRPTTQGAVLLLLLEDSIRRVQRSFRQCFGPEPPPERLFFTTQWPRFTKAEGGVEQLDAWLRTHPDARLVVIDTLKKVRPPVQGRHLYNEDYEAIEPLQELAQEHGVTIMVVHHLRKQDAEDPIDMLSGSTGLAAAADGILILTRARGEVDAALQVVHREGEELTLPLTFDPETTTWKSEGDADVLRLTRQRREVIEQLPDNGALHYKDIAQKLGKKEGTVKKLLSDMVKSGDVKAEGAGMYSRLPDLFGNSGNPGNLGNLGDVDEAPPVFDAEYFEQLFLAEAAI